MWHTTSRMKCSTMPSRLAPVGKVTVDTEYSHGRSAYSVCYQTSDLSITTGVETPENLSVIVWATLTSTSSATRSTTQHKRSISEATPRAGREAEGISTRISRFKFMCAHKRHKAKGVPKTPNGIEKRPHGRPPRLSEAQIAKIDDFINTQMITALQSVLTTCLALRRPLVRGPLSSVHYVLLNEPWFLSYHPHHGTSPTSPCPFCGEDVPGGLRGTTIGG